MELYRQRKTFLNKDGKEVEFYRYYVVINGIEIELKPNDNTARQVLNMFWVEK